MKVMDCKANYWDFWRAPEIPVLSRRGGVENREEMIVSGVRIKRVNYLKALQGKEKQVERKWVTQLRGRAE